MKKLLLSIALLFLCLAADAANPAFTDFFGSNWMRLWTNGNKVHIGYDFTGKLTFARPLFLDVNGNITNVLGTPDGTKFVRDDGVLATPPGSGGGTPGGDSGAVQYTEGTDFAGDNTLFNFNATNYVLTLGKTGSDGSVRAKGTSASTLLTKTGLMQESDVALVFGQNNTAYWSIANNPDGAWLPATDLERDIGSLSFRPSTIYAGTVKADASFVVLGRAADTITTNTSARLFVNQGGDTNVVINFAKTNVVIAMPTNDTFMVTIANTPSGGDPAKQLYLYLYLTNGSYTVSWPSGVDFRGGNPVVIPNATNLYVLDWSGDHLSMFSGQDYSPPQFQAGSSTSNLFVGGRFFFDSLSHTNHSTLGCFTNMANVTVPAHLLTNYGSRLVMHASGQWLLGTNRIQLRFGSQTNFADTGELTNVIATPWWATAEVRSDTPLIQHITWAIGWQQNVFAHSVTNGYAVVAETNGIGTVLAVVARAFRAGGVTNDDFYVEMKQ